MKTFNKYFSAFLCILLVASVCACGKKGSSSGGGGGNGGGSDSGVEKEIIFTVEKEDAIVQCESFFDNIISGNLEDLNKMIPLGTMLYGDTENEIQNGIVFSLFEGITYTVKDTKSLDDGSMLISLEIENTDLKKLLLSLPDGISSKEEAREKMKELLPSTPRKTFEAELYVVSYGDDIEPGIIVTQSLANALTGGINDIIAEFFAEETTNEATN
ncbi:MAG: hypothetical protein IJC81_00230 [Clostridia bacterium]|nr:hypothetical protein [Clostridia bacterium]